MTSEISAAEKEQLLQAVIAGDFPDKRGRFGPFGGRYVPETLIPAMERLEQGVREHLRNPEFQEALGRELRTWIGRPTALTHATHAVAALGRADVAEARGSRAHRRPQDQQRHRPGAAGQAHRRAARGGRDRSRPARRRRRRGLRARRSAVRRCTWAKWTWSARHRTSGACACSVPRVEPVKSGDRTLRAAIDEAMRDWVSDPTEHVLPARVRRSVRIPIPIWCASCRPSSAVKRARRCSRRPAACRTP